MLTSFLSRKIFFRISASSVVFCTLILTTFLQANSIATRAATPDPINSSQPASTTAPTMPQSSSSTAHAVMHHMPNGKATMTYNASQKTLTVHTTLTGLQPNSTHPVQIEEGTCSSGSDGNVRYHLNDLTADNKGQVNTSVTVNNVTTAPPTSGLRINVYNGPGMQSTDEKVSIACGDIRAQTSSGSGVSQNSSDENSSNDNTSKSEESSSSNNSENNTSTSNDNNSSNNNEANTSNSAYTAHLGPTQAANEHANGTTALRLTNGTLTVQISAHNLAPNSSHAAHIHEGTCQQIGKVVYDLSPLKADASGNTTKTMTFNNVSSIPNNALAVQVHYGTDLSKQETYNPIMCGNVVTGAGQPTQTPQPTSTP